MITFSKVQCIKGRTRYQQRQRSLALSLLLQGLTLILCSLALLSSVFDLYSAVMFMMIQQDVK